MLTTTATLALAWLLLLPLLFLPLSSAQLACAAGTCAACPLLQRMGEAGAPAKGQWNPLAIKHIRAQRTGEAVEAIRIAILQQPYRADVLNNACQMMRDHAKTLLANQKDAALALMREAIAACKLALLVGIAAGDASHAAIQREVEGTFVGWFGRDECVATSCARGRAMDEAVRLMRADEHIGAVNALCGKGKHLSVKLGSEEKRCGTLNLEHALQLYVTFRVCGVVRLKGLLPQEDIDAIRADDDLDLSLPTFQTKGEGAGGEETEDEASRGHMRTEKRLPARDPFTRPVLAPALLNFAKLATLERRLEIDTFSHVTSQAGSTDQAWHGDVSFLFTRTHLSSKDHRAHLPPHGVVVVVPLVDLNDVTGPTEYCMGSHVNLGIDYWDAHCTDPASRLTPVGPVAAKTGGIIIFDVRIRHRGKVRGKRWGKRVERRGPCVFCLPIIPKHSTSEKKREESREETPSSLSCALTCVTRVALITPGEPIEEAETNHVHFHRPRLLQRHRQLQAPAVV
jgi:hypothetical protein